MYSSRYLGLRRDSRLSWVGVAMVILSGRLPGLNPDHQPQFSESTKLTLKYFARICSFSFQIKISQWSFRLVDFYNYTYTLGREK